MMINLDSKTTVNLALRYVDTALQCLIEHNDNPQAIETLFKLESALLFEAKKIEKTNNWQLPKPTN